jgi:proteasome lid subunit RPN8/RPN11
MNQVVAEQKGPDVAMIDVSKLPERTFPAGKSFRVFFAEDAHQEVWEHARSTLAEGDAIKEVGGLLVGEIYRDEAGPFLEIKGAIRGEHTRNEGTEVCFTPETWAKANADKDRLYPHERIVGWYHTHPRFGIFLSDRDQFVHRHSFPQPWAIAFVVDPVQALEGVFVWTAGDPKEVQEYWAGSTRKFQEPPREARVVEASALLEHAGVSRWTFLATVVFGLLALGTVAGFFYRNELVWAAQQELIMRALASERQELDRTQQAVAQLQGQFYVSEQKSNQNDSEVRGQVKEVEAGLRKVKSITQALEGALNNSGKNQPPSDSPNGRNP